LYNLFPLSPKHQSPLLIHIPPAMKTRMKLVLQVLNERVKFPVGYAKSLYKMNGSRICDPCELEMYNNYVVASNNEVTERVRKRL